MAELLLKICRFMPGLAVLYLVSLVIYRLYLHPLSKVPGPKSWAISRLPYIRALWRGSLVIDVSSLHRQFGDIVRLAPDEVSCATSDSWQPVHGQVAGKHPFPLDPKWFSKPPGEAPSIRTASDPRDHARIRRLLQHSFTDKTLASNESIVQKYVSQLITTLRAQFEGKDQKGTAQVNMVDYFNFATFDIIGDLCFAEPFECLQASAYHPWVSKIYEHIRASAFMATTRFYPLLSRQLMRLIPAHILAGAKEHRQTSVDKIRRRLNMEQERPDFMTPVMSKHGAKHGMSVAEIESTFHVLLTAGSETTSLVLSGILHYLLRSPVELTLLSKEIRGSFSDAIEITFASVRQLAYLQGVLHEGLRLCPPHPSGNPRVVTDGGEMVGRYWLPGGTAIAVHQWSLFRSPSYFHKADSFHPERWLPFAQQPESPYFHDNRSAVLAFGTGPHRCIGKDLAMSEMALIFANLVWHFDLSLASDENAKWGDQKTYFMVKRDPIWTSIKARTLEMGTDQDIA